MCNLCVCRNKAASLVPPTQNGYPAGPWVASCAPDIHTHSRSGTYKTKILKKRILYARVDLRSSISRSKRGPWLPPHSNSRTPDWSLGLKVDGP